MPSVDKILESDLKIIEQIENDTLDGFRRSTPSMTLGQQKILAVDSTSNPNVFIDAEKPKKKIVLHTTVGILSSDIRALTRQKNMSTAYLIARDGTIIELFNPSKWSYHLGRGSVGGNGFNSGESIGIEISNYGPLDFKEEDGEEAFYTVYGSKFASGNEKMNDDGEVGSGGHPVVTRLENAYRGFKYYASMTEAQYKALKTLLGALETRFAIPHNFIPYENRFKVFATSQEAKDFKGICTHVNFRPTGKWDIGPYFKWDKITDLSEDAIDFTTNNEEELEGLEVIKESKYDGSEDNYEFEDTIDPITGKVTEFASDKKTRIICENNSLICGL